MTPQEALILAQPHKCGAKRRGSEERCQDWAIVGARHCRRHGSGTAAAHASAREAMRLYAIYSQDAPWWKAHRLRKAAQSERRYEMRLAKKAGPEAVAHLRAQWAAEEAEKQAWRDDTRRAKAALKAESLAAWRAQQAAKNGDSFGYSAHDDIEQPGYVPYDNSIEWDI